MFIWLLESWICGFMSFIKFGKCLPIISLKNLLAPLICWNSSGMKLHLFIFQLTFWLFFRLGTLYCFALSLLVISLSSPHYNWALIVIIFFLAISVIVFFASIISVCSLFITSVSLLIFSFFCFKRIYNCLLNHMIVALTSCLIILTSGSSWCWPV